MDLKMLHLAFVPWLFSGAVEVDSYAANTNSLLSNAMLPTLKGVHHRPVRELVYQNSGTQRSFRNLEKPVWQLAT